jgi:site-specific DNA-methyltransferase (cytosine-N4-specific)
MIIFDKFQKDNQGAIPANLIEIAHTKSNSAYLQRCKTAETRPHPAGFSQGFTELFIRFLTDRVDIALDPFAGSNTTSFVAQTFQRRWICFEINEDYLMESRYRFSQDSDYLKSGE